MIRGAERLRLAMPALTLTSIILASAGAAAQQPPPVPRGQLEIDGAYRATSDSFSDTASPTINAEPSRITTTYEVPGGFAFSGSGAVRVWRNLAIGAGVSRFQVSADAAIAAAIPHPFTFNQPRDFEGTVSGVTREETTVTLQVRGFFPVSRRVLVSVFGGPAWIAVSQSYVTRLDYAEAYPYDSATFRGATTAEASKTKVGVGVGGDVAYYFSRRAGVGVGLRYAGGKVQLPLMGGDVETTTGGFEIGAGLRLRF